MTLVVLPDVHAAVVSYLLARSEVTDLVDDRVLTRLDVVKAFPSLTVTRPRGGGPRGSSWKGMQWVTRQAFDLNAWAATDNATQANDLYRVTAGVLAEASQFPDVFTPLGVVVSAVEVGTDRDASDPYFNDGEYRPRQQGEVVVTAHPAD